MVLSPGTLCTTRLCSFRGRTGPPEARRVLETTEGTGATLVQKNSPWIKVDPEKTYNRDGKLAQLGKKKKSGGEPVEGRKRDNRGKVVYQGRGEHRGGRNNLLLNHTSKGRS